MGKFFGLQAKIQLTLTLCFSAKESETRLEMLTLELWLWNSVLYSKQRHRHTRKHTHMHTRYPPSTHRCQGSGLIAESRGQRPALKRDLQCPITFSSSLEPRIRGRIRFRLALASQPSISLQLVHWKLWAQTDAAEKSVSIAQLFQACLSIFSSEDVLVRTQTI